MIEDEKNVENSILYEVLVYHEWHQENEGTLKKPRNDAFDISTVLASLNPFQLLRQSICSFDIKSVLDLPWKLAVSHDGAFVAVLQETLLEIRATRDGFTSVLRKISVGHDQFPQLRLMAWSPDCTILAVSRETGIYLYNLLGNNLAFLPQSGVQNPVVGLVFLNTKFKNIKWSCELLTVSFDGTVRSFLFSTVDGVSEENINFSLKCQHPHGITCVVYHPDHHILLVSGKYVCGREISAWRILNDSPFLKPAIGMENASAGVSRWRRLFARPPDVLIKRMKVSPDGRNLVSIDSNGSVAFWSLPGVKLTKTWPISDQPGFPLDTSPKNGEKFFPVDIEWWSNRAVIIVRKNGAITVCSMNSLENLLGDSAEFLFGPPQVAAIRAEREGVVLLDCEVVVNSRHFGDEDEAEEEEDDGTSILQETIQMALYEATDIQTFQPRKRAAKHVQKTYRLVGINEITSEILFHREIERGAFENALNLAEKYALDSDLVYQRQWQMNPISPETITTCLSKIKRLDWVANECVRCVPDTFEAAWKLLEFGMEITNGDPRIAAYLDGLRLYDQILSTREHYDKNEYEELRELGTLEAAVKYAREGHRDALLALLSLRTLTVLPHWLPILSNFPETLSPKFYRELLPKFINGSAENWAANWATGSSPIFEENDDVIYVNPRLKQFKTNHLTDVLMYEWMKARAFDIDEFSGSVENALVLAKLVLENGVADRDRFLNHLRSLDQIVRCVDDSISLKYWDTLSHLDQALMLMKNTRPATFIADVKKKLVPFVECVDCDPVDLVTDLVRRFAADGLDLPLAFFRFLREPGKKDPIFRVDTVRKIQLILDCLYGYPRDDQLEQSFQIFECLPRKSESCDERERKLHEEVDQLEERLVACETLSHMGCPKSLSYLKNIADDVEKGTELIRLAAATKRDVSNLRNDLLDIRAALPLVSDQICYELSVRAALVHSNPVNLTPALSYLTLIKNEPKRVPFDRSVELILEAATAHFDTSVNFERPENNIAWQILSLVREPSREINELKGLIKALAIIRDDVPISPLNVRRMANRWQLLEKCIRSSPRIYKNEFLALADCLGLDDGNRNIMEGKAYSIAAYYAYEKGDFEFCIYLCTKIVALDYAPAWEIVQKIGKHREYFQPKTLDFLAFSILHCPRDFLEDLLETRISLRSLQI